MTLTESQTNRQLGLWHSWRNLNTALEFVTLVHESTPVKEEEEEEVVMAHNPAHDLFSIGNFLCRRIGITFFSMCQMAPSILFQWDISNFNGPYDDLNVPKDKMRYGV